jgi:two-component system, cell cycle response regulator DivK
MKDARDIYASYLESRGFGAVTARDGEEAIAVATSVRPDVIVMDLSMPKLDGIEATRRLKRDPRTRTVPVIILTGYAYKAIEGGALEAGAAAFLTKPCAPDELEAAIRRLLDRPTAPS